MTLKKIFDNHIIMSGVYKGISGLSLFVTIRLLMDYLGQDNYGLWVLVFTLFQLVLLMDFGIQSALKTKIPVLLLSSSIDFLKAYIKSTYQISAIIASFIFIFFIFLVNIIDLKSLLNIDLHTRLFVNSLFLINIFFFSLTFVANIHKSLYVAFLKGKYAEESLAYNQLGLLVLTALFIVLYPNVDIKNKLLGITLINGFFTFFINIFYTLRFFKLENLNLKTKIDLENTFLIQLIKLGSKYMFIQLGVVILFSIDNYLISYFFTPFEVPPFEIVNKYFQFPLMIIIAALSPLWSVFAKDYLDKNKNKLQKSFKSFNFYFLGIFFLVLIATFVCPFVIKLWIKEEINTPFSLILIVAIITLLRIFSAFYTYFLNGIGHLGLYLKIVALSLIFKVPLSYFFVSLGLEINGILIATAILMLTWAIALPIKSYKLVNKLKFNE